LKIIVCHEKVNSLINKMLNYQVIIFSTDFVYFHTVAICKFLLMYQIVVYQIALYSV